MIYGDNFLFRDVVAQLNMYGCDELELRYGGDIPYVAQYPTTKTVKVIDISSIFLFFF